MLSRVEPVAHVSRQLGRVKVTRRPVLAGERDVSVSRAFRVGDPDLNSANGWRPAVPKPRPPRGVRQPANVPVKVPSQRACAQAIFLLSRTTLWGVLINTVDAYVCEDCKQTIISIDCLFTADFHGAN